MTDTDQTDPTPAQVTEGPDVTDGPDATAAPDVTPESDADLTRDDGGVHRGIHRGIRRGSRRDPSGVGRAG